MQFPTLALALAASVSAAAIKRTATYQTFEVTNFYASSTPHGDVGYVHFNVTGLGNKNPSEQNFGPIGCSGSGLGYQSLPSNVSALCSGKDDVNFYFDNSGGQYYLELAHVYQELQGDTSFLHSDNGKHYFSSNEIIHDPGQSPTGAFVFVAEPNFAVPIDSSD